MACMMTAVKAGRSGRPFYTMHAGDPCSPEVTFSTDSTPIALPMLQMTQ
jgi:hypothetical protein